MTDALHDDELPIDLALVRALVARARPEFASLPLARLDSSGSTNALFRLGAELVVRLPRQPGGSATIDKEARWLPQIAPLLPVPVPQVVAVEEPDLGYPERWSIVTWLSGDTPTVVDPTSDDDPGQTATRRLLAQDLAAAVTALHAVDVSTEALADPELRWYRGKPLATMDRQTRSDIEACRNLRDLHLDLDAAAREWDVAMALPGAEQASSPRWYHGDLLAENLLVREGRLAGVLDFGGLSVGDPTIDLVVAWELFDASSREVFRQAVGVDDDSWLRGRAWALAVALMTFAYYWHTMPERCASRLSMARSVLADA